MTDTKLGLIQRLADALEGHIDHVPAYKEEVAEEQADLIDQARAYLAQPEPEGPTDEELEEFALKHGGGYFNCDCQAEADILTRKHVSDYRAVLARWGRPAIEPVPVSERPWEREGWCDKDGRFLVWNAGECQWWEWTTSALISFTQEDYTHSIPHYALPIPELTTTTQEDNLSHG